MSSLPPSESLVAPRRDPKAAPALIGWALGSTVLAGFLYWPLFYAEPVFSAISVAVSATLPTLGYYLAFRQRERFSGFAFMLAGLSWYFAAIDGIVPRFGPYLTWILSGTTYILIGWAVLRYRRPNLPPNAERRFVSMALGLTVGTSFVTGWFIDPEVLGYAPGSFWPLLPEPLQSSSIAIVIICCGYGILAGYFCILMACLVRAAPPISRQVLKPMALFGAILAAGAALVQTAASLAPQLFTMHQAVGTVGALILCLSVALAVSMVLQRMVGSRLLAFLPSSRTPESVTAYLRSVIGDPTAELLYWSPEIGVVVDETGRRRVAPSRGQDSERFSTWILDDHGGRVALVVGRQDLSRDAAALASLGEVLSIIAENVRLNVVLRTRLAELTATRTAEKLAFEKAREEFHRDLHDGLQQTIAAAALDMDGLRELPLPSGGAVVVNSIGAKLELALEQVHSLKNGNSPPELRFGLKPAIDRVIAQLRLSAESAVTDADLGILTLPIYYIVRESLTNIHKHAKATRVAVSVVTDLVSVDVVVHDDGIGGAVESEGGGVFGMRRRVEELGGVLRVESGHGFGTTLTARIPLIPEHLLVPSLGLPAGGEPQT